MSDGTRALENLAESVRRALRCDPEIRAFLLARVADDRAACPPERRQVAEIGFQLRAFEAGFPVASQRMSVARYADHPDYDPAWAPDPTPRRGGEDEEKR